MNWFRDTFDPHRHLFPVERCGWDRIQRLSIPQLSQSQNWPLYRTDFTGSLTIFTVLFCLTVFYASVCDYSPEAFCFKVTRMPEHILKVCKHDIVQTAWWNFTKFLIKVELWIITDWLDSAVKGWRDYTWIRAIFEKLPVDGNFTEFTMSLQLRTKMNSFDFEVKTVTARTILL